MSNFIVPAIVIIVLIVFFTMVPVGLWITARFSGVNISMGSLVAMRFRRLNPSLIVNALIKSHQAGLEIRTEDLESHYLAGGNINQVVDALIAAERANIDLTFEQAAAIDLAGRNVFEAVQVSVTPKVINTPVIAAVAKNGIEVKVIAKVTVRANIERLVGGAGEETIIARVGEGIVTTVGSAKSHAEVLENPDNISQTVLLKGLDSGTAYEILSIDIADVDVGRNVGAELQRDQAEADKNIAQAKAEERRAQAIALEQENRAKVVDAEAKIPEAISKAFEDGNLGIMDYYNMKNINADTKMRESLSDVDSGDMDV
ncbi:flotillin-like protein FloA [Anaerococcus sp.]|uniref:flotillin-like protein FloA n=1 Tax=Anaerococcus sp. TaxID=1872515 RepID=UPI00258AE1B1|nr:flotillin-like protein FloA [Anaerococcus sp.]MDU3211038.1 flotillin-like protein FloA [Anaerococcus sp.]